MPDYYECVGCSRLFLRYFRDHNSVSCLHLVSDSIETAIQWTHLLDAHPSAAKQLRETGIPDPEARRNRRREPATCHKRDCATVGLDSRSVASVISRFGSRYSAAIIHMGYMQR